MKQITIAALRSLLDFDPATGALVWKSRGLDQCKSKRAQSTFNSRFAGKDAGTPDRNGHINVCISGGGGYRRYGAHRLAWAIHYGEWPEGEIDHVNHDTSDNRISNLRDVSHSENLKNQSLRRNSKSGVTGVSWHSASGKWRASIHENGKGKYLGVYESKDDAVEARRCAEAKFGFHKNHGNEGAIK